MLQCKYTHFRIKSIQNEIFFEKMQITERQYDMMQKKIGRKSLPYQKKCIFAATKQKEFQ
jgi:hypothetical protein